VIPLTEYHASSIRLRRVILLCSVIRLTPSDICFASLSANRISLKTQGFNITFARRKYHADECQHITLQTKRKRRLVTQTNLLFSVVSGFGLLPGCIFTYKCDTGSWQELKKFSNSPLRTSRVSAFYFYIVSPPSWVIT